MSPALAGGFLTIVPPGKSLEGSFLMPLFSLSLLVPMKIKAALYNELICHKQITKSIWFYLFCHVFS